MNHIVRFPALAAENIGELQAQPECFLFRRRPEPFPQSRLRVKVVQRVGMLQIVGDGQWGDFLSLCPDMTNILFRPEKIEQRA